MNGVLKSHEAMANMKSQASVVNRLLSAPNSTLAIVCHAVQFFQCALFLGHLLPYQARNCDEHY